MLAVQSNDDKSKASPRQNSSTTQLSSPAVHPFSCTSSGFSIWKHVPSLATPPSETHHRPHPTPKDHPHSYATHPYYRFCSTYGSILNHGLNWTRMLAPPPFPALPSTPRMLYWKFPNYFNHFFPMEFRPPSSSPDLGSPLLHSQRTDLSASNTEQISTRTSSADENSRSIQSAPTTSNRKYSCDLCGRTFSRTNTLVTHRVISLQLLFCYFKFSVREQREIKS